MKGVLNRLVPTDRFHQEPGTGFFLRQTGYKVGDFLTEIVALKVSSRTNHLDKLSGIGEICLPLLYGCNLDFTFFNLTQDYRAGRVY